MALKEYAYYMQGNKISLIEREAAFDNYPNSKDYGPGTDKFQWKSPLTSVDNGVEILYTYSPIYNIYTSMPVSINSSSSGAGVFYGFGWTVLGGYLTLVLGTDGSSDDFLDFSNTSYDEELGSAGQAIVIQNSNKWNGVHKLKARGLGYIQLETKVYGYPHFEHTNAYDMVASTGVIDTDDMVDDNLMKMFADTDDDADVYFMFAEYVAGAIGSGDASNIDRIYRGKLTDNDSTADTLTVNAIATIEPTRNNTNDVWKFSDYTSGMGNSFENKAHRLLRIQKDSGMMVYGKNTAEIMEDESFNIDLPSYLSKAAVDYVKAKYLEDQGQFKESEYFMAKFRKQIEKYNNGLIGGPRKVATGSHAIR